MTKPPRHHLVSPEEARVGEKPQLKKQMCDEWEPLLYQDCCPREVPKREHETQGGGTKGSHCSDDAGATAEIRLNPTIGFLLEG